MLLKGVYHCQYTDDWEKLNETSFPETETFYSHLNVENITDADYTHEKGVCKDFEIKTFRRILWFVCSNSYIIFTECVWEFSKYVSWNMQTWLHSFSYCTMLSTAK